MRLKVRNAAKILPFCGKKLALDAVLLGDRKGCGLREISAAVRGTVNAPTDTAATVAVGTGKAAVQGDLGAFRSKCVAQIIVVGVIALVRVAILKRIIAYL